MIKVAYIKTFFDNMVLPYIIPDGMTIETNKWYIINTKFGEDIGLSCTNQREIAPEGLRTSKKHHDITSDTEIDDIEIDDEFILQKTEEHIPIELENNRIIREAKEEEIREREKFASEEPKAFQDAVREITELKLEMKLINVHFLLNKKKVIFNFTADSRIDFRQLVKRLASIFRTRIEMRQIGVRDAAKILGGYGVCGEICCCIRSNCHVNSIFLKMAKDQGFVVNSSKLTGLCGRLMCCLAYENDFYVEERKKYPEIGSVVIDGQKQFRVFSINVLKDEVYVIDEHHHQKSISHTALRLTEKDRQGVCTYKIIENRQIQ
jgi:cell fate regulator YaaT (PSP1 superfamily)